MQPRKAGFSTLGDTDSVLLVGPMAPATNLTVPGCASMYALVHFFASSAAVLLIRYTCAESHQRSRSDYMYMCPPGSVQTERCLYMWESNTVVLAHLLWNVQLIVALADGGAVEGVGLQDVGTRLQESRVDLLNNLKQVHSTLESSR